MASSSSLSKNLGRIGSFSFLLIILAAIGFWPSYLSQLGVTQKTISFYFHFHALVVSAWILLLILQPILIINGNNRLHRILGKLSYGVFPLMILSIVWVAHLSFTSSTHPSSIQLFIPFKDVLLLSTLFGMGIYYKRKPIVHAKAMIATGIICIEPALIRTVIFIIGPTSLAYPITIIIIYSIILGFIVYERNHSSGRWIMAGLLFVLMLSHLFILSGYESIFWNHFTKWFSNLPLT